jgi:hypothetical protein
MMEHIAFLFSMALQRFGPWPFFQFLILNTVGRIPWTGKQAIARPLPTHRTTQTQTDIHETSGIRTHDPSVRAGENGSCLRPCCNCDRQYIACLREMTNAYKILVGKFERRNQCGRRRRRWDHNIKSDIKGIGHKMRIGFVCLSVDKTTLLRDCINHGNFWTPPVTVIFSKWTILNRVKTKAAEGELPRFAFWRYPIRISVILTGTLSISHKYASHYVALHRIKLRLVTVQFMGWSIDVLCMVRVL